jgi:hypothetical protein
MTNRYRGVAHGQLFIQSLLPQEATVYKLGGPETPYIDASDRPFCTDFGGRSYGDRAMYWTGQYRLELRSPEPEFLTVMQIGDADHLTAMDTVRRLSAPGASGALIGDRVVVFRSNPGAAAMESLQYSLETSSRTRHLVVNLLPHRYYEVTVAGRTQELAASGEGTLYFEDDATGEHLVRLVEAGAAPEPSFEDVPLDHPYYPYIEALYQAGYVAGCSETPLLYCPERAMNRAESAVFVERGVWGADFMPPEPIAQIFADVPLGLWYTKWANHLWEDGYTAGCGTDPLIYCPERGHTRAEGAVFFLRMLHGTEYEPPAAEGLFGDVSMDAWYADWVEAAYKAGLIEPCAQEPLSYCPMDPLTRAVGAYMMAQAKGLAIP